jgi:hypothetical protein
VAIRINIRREGDVVIEPAEVTFSDVVFWFNGDTEPHAPMGIDVQPQATSSSVQPVPTGSAAPLPVPLPQSFSYQCALHGESGTIAIYNDFVPIVSPLSVTKPATTVQVATGGKPPYVIAPSGEPSVTLVEAPQSTTADAGINAVLTNPPATVTFRLSATDALGNSVDQDVTINVS